MKKQTIYICENKDADQLRGNREADQCLCFRYRDSTITLLSKSKISSLYQSPVLVQLGLCQTCSETILFVFSYCKILQATVKHQCWIWSHDSSNVYFILSMFVRLCLCFCVCLKTKLLLTHLRSVCHANHVLLCCLIIILGQF